MVIVTTAVYWGLSSPLRIHSQFPLTFQHRAGVSPYTSSYDFARTCVFGKQSLPPILCAPHRNHQHVAATAQVPLLPKLRGHFAEFLHHDSLDRLGILYQSTSVGLGYGRLTPRSRSFSRQHRITRSPHKHGSPSCLNSTSDGFTYQTVHTFSPGQPSPGTSYLTVSLRSLSTT